MIFDSPDVVAAIREQLARIRLVARERAIELKVSDPRRSAIAAALASGNFDGMNPVNSSRKIAKLLGLKSKEIFAAVQNETQRAQVLANRRLMAEQGIARYAVSSAGDHLVCAICENLAANGPYEVSAESAPLPGWHTCETCRCSIGPCLSD